MQQSTLISRAIIGLLLQVPVVAFAQESSSDAQTTTSPDRWRLRAEPAVWFLGPAGSLRLPTFASGSTAPATSDDAFEISDLKIDTPEASPFAEVHLSRGDWRFSIRGVSMSGEEDFDSAVDGNVGDFAFVIGDAVRVDFDYAQFEGEVGYLFKDAALEPYEGGHKLHSKLELVGGARVYSMEWQITNIDNGSRAFDDLFFVEPYAGAKLSLEFYERFDADLQVVLGGLPVADSSSFSIDVIVGGTYRFNEHVGLQLGYRLTGFDLEKDDAEGEFNWSGSVAGLYLGAVLEF
jgi:hypothetical protein